MLPLLPMFAVGNLQKQEIPLSATSAVCNDGSPYAYFLGLGTETDKWVFFQQGGSYCWDEDSCNSRGSNYMSSNGLPSTETISVGILSDDASNNPYYAAWNKVLIPYCTSDAFSGTVEKASWKSSLSFLGSRVIPSLIADLKASHGLIDDVSTTVIYAGASAGGVGMYPNLDILSGTLLPSSNVVGVIDSGWFMDSVPYVAQSCKDALHCSVEANIKLGMTAWSPSVDADCSKDKPADQQWQCMMGKYVEPYISTPIFVFEWQFDLAQLYHDGIEDNPSGAAATLTYAQTSSANLTKTFAAAQRHHMFFSPSCYQHVVLNTKHPTWAKVTAGGVALADALNDFVIGKTTSSTLLDECKTPDCNPTCPPDQHIG
jgi:O-palmitoleoyl-L-serine hydrolase